MAIFEFCDVTLEPQYLAGIGLALVGPLVPFVRKISFPSGPTVEMATPLPIDAMVRGERDSQAGLADYDMNAIATGE